MAGAIASDVIWNGVVVPGKSGVVVPVLQLADGSFVGSVYGFGTGNSMVAFDASGNVKWTVPGYSPSMATADGGIIASAGSAFDPNSGTFLPGPVSTFDANGNATGQVGGLSTFSWKGAYQFGSVESVAVPQPTLLPTFAAVSNGNLSGNGTALVQHSFGLFWCGNGYLLQGYLPGSPCTQGNGNDVQWLYYRSSIGPSDSHDFGADHPDWVGMIQSAALTSFKAAYAKYPITVQLAGQTPSCLGPFCLINSKPDQEYTVYVLGDNPPPTAGQRFIGTNDSGVYYRYFMENAQIAFGQPKIPSTGAGWLTYSPSYPPQDTTRFVAMLRSMGAAIGDAAAHEIGHHLEGIRDIEPNGNLGFPFMDCGLGNPGDRNRPTPTACENNDNFVYSFYTADGFPQDPANSKSTGAMFFYGVPGTGQPGAPFQPAIHWGRSNICWLQNYGAPDSCKQP